MKKQIIMAALTVWAISLSAQIKEAKHIVLVGFDGLGSYAIPKADMPHLKRLMDEGASSLRMRSVLPSSSAVNWASMLMGASPTMHGYTEWGSKTPEIPSAVTTSYSMFPSIFSVVREAHPAANTAVVYSWDGIGHIVEQPAITHVVPGNGDEDKTLDSLVHIIKTHKPLLTFAHFDQPDGAGHKDGHDTPAYYRMLKTVDQRIGRIIQAIAAAGIAEETVLIIASDHGGVGKGHGGKTLAEVEVPLVITGPGVQKGKALSSTIVIYDVAATMAWILGLEAPQAWRGQPITEAFVNR